MNFNGEYNFTDTMGVTFGAGLRVWDFTVATTGNSAKLQYRELYLPITFRLRPLPWIIGDSGFTLYLGAGGELSAGTLVKITNSSGSDSDGSGKGRFGLLLEAGIGYYVTNGWLIQGGLKYNIGLNNDNATTSSTINYKPTLTEFTFGMRFKI